MPILRKAIATLGLYDLHSVPSHDDRRDGLDAQAARKGGISSMHGIKLIQA